MTHDNKLTITLLGTGTSTGVPMLQCNCDVCLSTDPHDTRMRTSALVHYMGRKLLIDCGPDFWHQMRSVPNNDLDALLVTHIHYDHVAGVDDLRAYCKNGRSFPIYARPDVIEGLKHNLPYCFVEHPYPGVPRLDLRPIPSANEPFNVMGIEVMPIPVMHYKMPIVGFKIGPLAYITDCKTIQPQEVERLKGIPLLVINALRPQEHLSHLTLGEALDLVRLIKPGRAVFTHMSHEMGLHREVNKTLPEGVELGFDGMLINV